MNFKKFLATTALAACLPCMFVSPVVAQEEQKEEKEEGYIFTDIKVLPVTSVKDQNAAGTCWCYSGLAFFEAELLRMGKPEYDFSEMYIVYNTYMDRAEATVRTHGDVSFAQGGSFYDVIYGMKHYGLVPEEFMRPGAMHGDSLSDFTEFSNVTDPFVEGITKNRKLQLAPDGTPLWKNALEGILNAYIGERPEVFVYEGKEYTPQTFFESTGLNPDDYVNLTSFTHHPFYDKFVIEVQDNWRWGTAYNLPIDEFMEVMDYAIDNGYPIAWGSDVSEKGWLRGANMGVVVLPDIEAKNVDKSNTDMAHWTGLTTVDREKEVEKFWEEHHIFEKSMEERDGREIYTFYDGPPTANGKPHIGHVLTRVIKDMIPRYRTMKGYEVPRKAGWDTHGLPVELEVEKALGLDGKDQI